MISRAPISHFRFSPPPGFKTTSAKLPPSHGPKIAYKYFAHGKRHAERARINRRTGGGVEKAFHRPVVVAFENTAILLAASDPRALQTLNLAIGTGGIPIGLIATDKKTILNVSTRVYPEHMGSGRSSRGVPRRNSAQPEDCHRRRIGSAEEARPELGRPCVGRSRVC